MFQILQTSDGYRIFQPGTGEFTNQLDLKRRCETRNREFVRGTPAPSGTGKITGTFVYGHAPDYPSSMLHADVGDWEAKLIPLCAAGIDTVIFQAAVWNELNECYYPSRRFKTFRQWNVIEPLLLAANRLKLKVFLGEYGAVTSWQESGTPEAFAAETECHLHCLEELHQLYGGGYHGVYFTSESWYQGRRDAIREEAMARLYRVLFDKARELDPTLPVLISPVSFYHEGKKSEMVEFWCSVFAGAAPDILAPQDSIGTLCCTLDHQQELYACWGEIARRMKLRLWANIELFDVGFPEPGRSRLESAPREYINAQIAAAAPNVEKLICWEALRFTLP